MKEFIDKLIERLEKARESAKRRNAFDSEVSYSCAIEIVTELAESYHIHCEQEYMRGYADAEKKLAEEYKATISKMENVGWIPCSERLPEIGQMCLCSVNYKKYTDVPYDIILCKYEERYINRWADWYTAWMPLPAPYAEGE